jgi:hypothetical protein
MLWWQGASLAWQFCLLKMQLDAACFADRHEICRRIRMKTATRTRPFIVLPTALESNVGCKNPEAPAFVRERSSYLSFIRTSHSPDKVLQTLSVFSHGNGAFQSFIISSEMQTQKFLFICPETRGMVHNFASATADSAFLNVR